MSFAGTSSSPKFGTPFSSKSKRINCFSISAQADPSVLPRILDIVAMFDQVPQRCHCSRLDHEADRSLMIDLQIADLSDNDVHLIEKKLERLVFVTQILCSEKRRAA